MGSRQNRRRPSATGTRPRAATTRLATLKAQPGHAETNASAPATLGPHAEPAVPDDLPLGRQGGYHRRREPDDAHEVGSVPPQGHHPPFARLGQEHHGRNLTSMSRRRGFALTLVHPACASQIASQTSLVQGRCRWGWFCCLGGAVLDAQTKAPCNIRARLHNALSSLWRPYREVKALFAERTRTAVGTVHPGLALPARANVPHQPRAKSPSPRTCGLKEL